MNSEFSPRPTPPSALYGMTGMVVLALVYLLVGVIGHDPWRGDDSVYFAPVHAMLHGQGWLLPQVAGRPFVDYPPLFYWVAAGCARLTAWLLPEHDGARLASAAFCGISLLALARAGLALWGRDALAPAGLLVVGCLGLVIYAHETQPLLALIAGQCVCLYACARFDRSPPKAGAWLGFGLACVFLAGGLSGLVLVLPPLLVLAYSAIAAPNRWRGIALGLGVALLLCLPWPLALHAADPAGFDLWWAQELADLAPGETPGLDLAEMWRNLGWFAWPLWPIALWFLWYGRRQLGRFGILLALAGLLPALILPLFGEGLRPVRMLPVLPPLALLAAGGATTLRRGAANAFDWFAVMTFGVVGVLVWMAWAAMVWGWPPGLGRQLVKLAPGFHASGIVFPAALGIAVCAAWISLLLRLPRSPVRPSFNWALGMTMLWCLAVALLMPWFQHGKTYRPAADSLAQALHGRGAGCIAEDGVSLSQRASFDYFAGLRFLSVENRGGDCPLRLVFRDRQRLIPAPGEDWERVWTFRRGGGKQLESFALFAQKAH